MKPNLFFLLCIAGGLLIYFGGDFPSVDLPQKDPDAWLVFVGEFDEYGSDKYTGYTELIGNAEWRKSLEDRNINFRVYDEEQKEAASYNEVLKEKPGYVVGSPFVENGEKRLKVMESGTAPKSPEEAEKIISKWIK